MIVSYSDISDYYKLQSDDAVNNSNESPENVAINR